MTFLDEVSIESDTADETPGDDHTGPRPATLVWTAEEIELMEPSRSDRQVLASPSPAFPAMSDFAISWLPRSSDRLVIDGAAGLGGVTDVLSARLDAQVLGIEQSPSVCRAARRLFPDSWFANAGTDAWPVRSRRADAVVLAGALSTLDDPAGIVSEADRVLTHDGRMVLLDVVASGGSDHRTGHRVFRSLETIEQLLPPSLHVVEMAAADGWLGDWHLAAQPVNRSIARRRRHEPAFEQWIEHQRELERVVSSGAVLLAGLVAARPTRGGVRPDGGSVRRLRDRRHRQP